MDSITLLIDPPQSWIPLLIDTKAAVERGDNVELASVLDRMGASIARVEACVLADHQRA